MSSKRRGESTETDAVISICRLCALVSSSHSFVPLYLENKEEQITTKQINRLVPNLISFDDGLPQDACHKCVDNVSKCFKYVNSVIETQDKLRQMIQMNEAEKINHASPSPNQFLENDQSSSATHADTFGLRTSRNDNIPRLNRAANVIRRPKNTTGAFSERAPDRVETINGTDIYSQRLSEHAFRSLSADVLETRDPPPPRLFRCGICFEKFSDKETCLKHIVDNHSSIRKPVQPTTIFETVRKNVDGGGGVKTSCGFTPSSGGGGANKSKSNSPVAQTVTKRLTNGVTPSPNDRRTSLESRPPAPNEPKKPTRHRKVLAIDSFYFEVGKRCTKYVCFNCGRMMMSRFAFLRHLYDHEHPPVKQVTEPAEIRRPRKITTPRVVRKYCNICNINVRDGIRHQMYHTIVKLESEFPSSACMLASSS